VQVRRTTIAEVIIETEEIETVRRRPARGNSQSQQPQQDNDYEKENQNDFDENESDS
jgi:hypothetical protein